SEPRFRGQALHDLQPGKDIPENPIVGAPIELALPGVPERVAVIPEAHGLPGGEVAADVVHRDDRLRQDILTQDAVFPAVITRDPAKVLLARQRDILPDAEFV